MDDITECTLSRALVETIHLTTSWEGLQTIKRFLRKARIDEGHDDIIRALGTRTEMDDPSWTALVGEMVQTVQEKKVEAEARKAEKANHITDADKVEALGELVSKLAIMVGKHPLDITMPIRLEPFRLAIERVKAAKTKAELEQMLAGLK